MKILLLNGSPNEKGNTYYILNEISKEIEAMDVEWEIASVHKAVMSAKWPFCTCCSQPCNQKCYLGTDLENLFIKMAEADCLVFGSPVYFGTMTAQLKALFDKTRSFRGEKKFVGKPAGVVAVGATKYGGQETTAGSIIDTLQVQGMTIFNNGYFDMDAGHKGVLAQRPAHEDANIVPLIKNFAKRAVSEGKKYEYLKTII